MSNVQVPDIPREEQVSLPKYKTALIIVDMQNDFAHPDGTLFGENTPAIVPALRDLANKARQAGVRVIYTQDWHGEDDPEFDIWPAHAKQETWGAELVDGLEPHENDTRIRKLRYDAFYGTSLDHILRGWGVEHVIVAGTVANICVLHTAGSAALRWYKVVVPEDGISALTPFDKESALRQVNFLYAGKVTTTAGIVFS